MTNRLYPFHTGLLATDYHRFHSAPYKGSGWRLELVQPSSELSIASEVVGDRIYPAKEVVIWARNEVSAQRAADLIHSARLLIDGSNLLSHIYPGEHAPSKQLEKRKKECTSRSFLQTPRSSLPISRWLVSLLRVLRGDFNTSTQWPSFG